MIYQIYQSSPGHARLCEKDFERILRDYLEWLNKAYGKARLYGLESLQTSGSQKKRSLSEVFIPLSLQRFAPPKRAEVEEHARNFKGDMFAEQRAFLALVDQKREGGKSIRTDALLTLGERMAVIGSAGSGKSTLLAYFAAMFAEHELSGSNLRFNYQRNAKPLCRWSFLCAIAESIYDCVRDRQPPPWSTCAQGPLRALCYGISRNAVRRFAWQTNRLPRNFLTDCFWEAVVW